jgi:hypothetical protein
MHDELAVSHPTQLWQEMAFVLEGRTGIKIASQQLHNQINSFEVLLPPSHTFSRCTCFTISNMFCLRQPVTANPSSGGE